MKHKEWIKLMNEYLGDFVKFCETITLKMVSETFYHSSSERDDIMKLLGSAFLCCGTLAAISKAKALPFLAV